MSKITAMRRIAPEPAMAPALPPGASFRAVLLALQPNGQLQVRARDGMTLVCDLLSSAAGLVLAPGDELLVAPSGEAEVPAVVLGRIGRYAPPQAQPRVTLEATESLTLRCGDAQVDLRANGQVMIKGEDVLLRAKGTQRIRAGNVAIN